MEFRADNDRLEFDCDCSNHKTQHTAKAGSQAQASPNIQSKQADLSHLHCLLCVSVPLWLVLHSHCNTA